ncbi:hypothetical protein GCM10011508_03690 [Flavobacterium lutivivi]|nr:hypothetical protein GCM10011508_03690 [Flavobacterium lutivivi]
MQINFIGHGLDPTNEYTVGNILVSSFIDKKFSSFYGFVAFASIAGVKKLVPSILSSIQNYKNLTFYIGVDDNGTSKEALQLLIDNKIETYIFNTKSALIFHPKIYLFQGKTWTRIIIGSTNLTNSGLFVNVEGAIQLDFRTSDNQGNKITTQIKNYFSRLIDKSHPNIEPLKIELLNNLIEKGLVTNEIHSTTPKSNNAIDENFFPELEKFDVNSIELGNLDLPDEIINNRNYDLEFSQNEVEKFPVFFEKWLKYKIDNPKSGGIVNRLTEDRALFNWFRTIKYLINKQKEIPLFILKQLEENDFPFEDGKLIKSRIRWNERFEELKEYVKIHNMNFAHVPQHKNPNHKYASLGQWCALQKQRRKGNQTPVWTEYEENKMKSINFKWETPNIGNYSTPKDEIWLENYFKLEEYKKLHGNVNPSQTDKNPEIKKLAKWLNDQRTLNNTGRKNKNGEVRKLLKERYELLIDIGVDFDYQLSKRKAELEKFITGYLELRKIYPDEKPKRGDTRFTKILEKKAELRFRYKDDKSINNKWRIDRLNEINFSWD